MQKFFCEKDNSILRNNVKGFPKQKFRVHNYQYSKPFTFVCTYWLSMNRSQNLRCVRLNGISSLIINQAFERGSVFGVFFTNEEWSVVFSAHFRYYVISFYRWHESFVKRTEDFNSNLDLSTINLLHSVFNSQFSRQ